MLLMNAIFLHLSPSYCSVCRSKITHGAAKDMTECISWPPWNRCAERQTHRQGDREYARRHGRCRQRERQKEREREIEREKEKQKERDTHTDGCRSSMIDLQRSRLMYIEPS